MNLCVFFVTSCLHGFIDQSFYRFALLINVSPKVKNTLRSSISFWRLCAPLREHLLILHSLIGVPCSVFKFYCLCGIILIRAFVDILFFIHQSLIITLP